MAAPPSGVRAPGDTFLGGWFRSSGPTEILCVLHSRALASGRPLSGRLERASLALCQGPGLEAIASRESRAPLAVWPIHTGRSACSCSCVRSSSAIRGRAGSTAATWSPEVAFARWYVVGSSRLSHGFVRCEVVALEWCLLRQRLCALKN